MTGFQRFLLATTLLVFVLILIGGTVRATDSGLGCPDWPRCHGSFIPKWEKHTLIEYSHRLAASVAGLMIFAVVAWAWRSYRQVSSIMIPAAVTGVLLLVQGGLGGLTVIHELPPEIVTVHLATALSLFALLILINVAAYAHERGGLPRPSAPANVGTLALAGAALTAAVMLLGAYVAGAGYSLACSGWPLCNGEVVPSASNESVWLIFMHRVLALVLGLSLVALAVAASRGAASSMVARISWTALGVYAVQVMVGAANIWSEVADVAQVAHLGVGTILWGVLAFLTMRLYGLHELFGRAEKRSASARLAGMAR